MSKIHYATGGLITPEKAEFSTLCGRKFPKGTRDIMDAGMVGAERVTCEDCREKLDWQERVRRFYDKLEIYIRKSKVEPVLNGGRDHMTKTLMRAFEDKL